VKATSGHSAASRILRGGSGWSGLDGSSSSPAAAAEKAGRRGGTRRSAGPSPLGARPGPDGSGSPATCTPSVSAPVGQPAVQAGSPPAARRGAQNVHLVITPRAASKRGASKGQTHEQ
jgi:hypothetical protein